MDGKRRNVLFFLGPICRPGRFQVALTRAKWLIKISSVVLCDVSIHSREITLYSVPETTQNSVCLRRENL